MSVEDVEQLKNDILNGKYEKDKIIAALEEYKWLVEFKPFEELVNKNSISTDRLLDACKAYTKWHSYTMYENGLKEILFIDGWRKPLEECEMFRVPREKEGLELDEDAWGKAVEERINKRKEEFMKNMKCDSIH